MLCTIGGRCLSLFFVFSLSKAFSLPSSYVAICCRMLYLLLILFTPLCLFMIWKSLVCLVELAIFMEARLFFGKMDYKLASLFKVFDVEESLPLPSPRGNKHDRLETKVSNQCNTRTVMAKP